MGTSDSSQTKKSSDKGNKKNEKEKPHFSKPLKSGGKSVPPLPSPSSEKGSPFKRSGSFGKGSVKAPTTPHRPMLATEARSLVRPCHCGKDGVFHGHTHNHNQHQRVSVTPERTIREHKAPRSPQVTRKTRGVTPPLSDQHHHKSPATKAPSSPTKTPPSPTKISPPPTKIPSAPAKAPSPTVKAPSKPLPKPSSIPTPTKIQTKDKGDNKFVSTVVWYPELEPEFNATKVKLCPGDDATRCIDKILVKEFDSYIKKKFPNSDDTVLKLEEPIYTKHVTTNNLISDFGSSLMQPVKASIS